MATKQIGVRIPEDIRVKVEGMACREGRNLSNMIIKILSEKVKK